ncbi:MAG TPA: ABC transporter permease [Bacteroidales bacterium]|nr:ABC transporter permease [Bacteroidales bacterium]
MLRNNKTTAFRSIRRYSTYSILNIIGMAIGMASAILILLWVQDEWSYDRHFKNADNLYRVIEKQYFSGGEVSQFAISPGILATALKEEFPEISRSTTYSNPQFPIQKGIDFIEAKIAVSDKEFINMFDIEFVRGDINSSMNGPYDMVVTENLANKYFNGEDPLGKTLKSAGWLFTITGIVKSMSHNSHIEFDILLPSELMEQIGPPVNDWDYRCYNYLQLQKGTDIKAFENKIGDYIKKNKEGSNSEILLQNIKKIHLFSSQKYAYDVPGQGDITYIRVLSLVAVFILIVACINFMNLSIALLSRRLMEIGIRKVNGAGKGKLIVRFLGESLLIVLVAHVVAMILVELLLPGYNNLIGKHIVVDYRSFGLYTGLISMVLFCGLLAGSYPSFYLASLKPIDIMKGIFGTNPGKAKFRSALVVFQFSLSVLLIICTLTVAKQLQYLKNKDLGYSKEDIGYFLFDTNPRDPRLETFKKEISNNPDVLSVTRARYNPVNVEGTWSGLKWTGKKEGDDVMFYVLGADEDYAKTFQLELSEGRFFSREFSTDNTALVINEEAAKIMSLKNPVGEILSTSEGAKFTIIGVVKDFNFKSLHTGIEPLIITLESCNTFYIKMKPDKTTSTLEFVNKTYNSYKNHNPLYFHFLDNDFANQYKSEQRTGKILSIFSFLAILISCLGLIGLSSFMTECRTKEIGIRKINGATAGEIFSRFSAEYMIWIIIAVIIACPIAWYVMNKWLHTFAFRIEMSWLVFALAGVLALIIALLTVSFQAFRAASKNPVEALRYE